MNWLTLLKPFRQGDQAPRSLNESKDRSIFEQDYDRIIFATPFRRLQDKTQVIPLPEHDFVHNRLTHSIEVSSVGRTLGKMVGTGLLQKYPELQKQAITHHDFGAIVAAAALAHDIGNPPFGHSGESAIGEYFLHGNGKRFQAMLHPNQWNDLIRFEGNANGFRILTNAGTGNAGGVRLSYPTLAAFTKYPKESLPLYPKGRASEKKFGFFQAEKEIYADIAKVLELQPAQPSERFHFRRHPLAFLVEAADDICYHIIDFEDGLRLRWIDFSLAEELLIPLAGDAFYPQSYEKIKHQDEKASYLRAVAINNLIREASSLFLEKEEDMLSGVFDTALLSLSKHKEAINRVKEISLQKIYKAREVIEIEAAGFEVIGGLLDMFMDALFQLCEEPGKQKSMRHQKIAELLPDYLKTPSEGILSDPYLRILAVCEFVAGLTDKHAIRLFRKMKGIELPR